MKLMSIKNKISALYALLLTVLLLFMLLGSFYTARSYTIHDAGEELRDEVEDLKETLLGHSDDFWTEDSSIYYDDSMIMGIYYENGEMIAGICPEGFPEGIPFVGNKLIHTEYDDHSWYYYDLFLKESPQGNIWIRGVHSCQLLDGLAHNLIQDMLLLIPVWLLILIIAGHFMTRRMFRPMTEMTRRAREISNSTDLSARLPKINSKDELAELSNTFNAMLEHLEHLLHSEKQFTSDAAHELRTPISVIISNCEYCLDEYTLEPELRKELELIDRKAHYLSDLVSRLLTIARAENHRIPFEPENMDISLLIELVLEELENAASKKGISLSLDCQTKETTIFGDQNLLMQIFMNLVENSIKYGKPHGHTHVVIQSDEQSLILNIQDDGIGIPPHSLSKIWERFYRVREDSAVEGMGLGLFMVRWAVERHGGKISVESAESVGSTFTIRFPLPLSDR